MKSKMHGMKPKKMTGGKKMRGKGGSTGGGMSKPRGKVGNVGRKGHQQFKTAR